MTEATIAAVVAAIPEQPPVVVVPLDAFMAPLGAVLLAGWAYWLNAREQRRVR